MTSLIKDIISKLNWPTKIKNNVIINKWKDEIIQKKLNPYIIDLIIKLLEDYYNNHKIFYDTDGVYDWHLNLDLDVTKFMSCNCKCLICKFNEYYIINEDDDDHERALKNKELKKINFECDITIKDCPCRLQIKKNKSVYLNTFLKQEYNLIDDKLLHTFKNCVSKLPRNNYHPNSNNQVIDLVHPSLYSYIDGLSIITIDSIEIKPKSIFQWLPAEFQINKDNTVKINSYINNLDQNEHGELYECIEHIFEKFVPLFQNLINKKFDNCQVIVKLCDYELTPENPYFNSSSWHLEGIASEKIIATGIYYYENTNITNSYLNFRGNVSNPDEIYYQQNCVEYVNIHYGFQHIKWDKNHNKTATIFLGNIKTDENLCLVFLNCLQHKVSSFELNDEKCVGNRKILVFFLIDPSTPILSTKHIKPQQSLINIDDAKIYQELLMFQRKYNIDEQNAFYEREWSLCEH